MTPFKKSTLNLQKQPYCMNIIIDEVRCEQYCKLTKSSNWGKKNNNKKKNIYNKPLLSLTPKPLYKMNKNEQENHSQVFLKHKTKVYKLL